ncbi:hypothetical protein GCM10011506_18860 [Marivirga lumbricoides]|uniref:Cytochrome b561 bacterial/Ni-hydrogenase domain-containing protein n=2 Tax=Marivirga lumbricoides TaxID=1046115 RepID=A0ABQ1M2I2_9BACT|nr:hypothetical protein GCM10011506_18860 [Marivirga lumbricoides]
MFSNKVNPLVLLGKIPAVKRKFEEQGTTLLDTTNKIWADKRFGFGIMISGSGLVISLAFLLWGLVTVSASFFNIYFYIQLFHVVAYGAIAYLICHLLVFKNNKYIKYFKKLDKRPKEKKWKYAIFSILFVIGCVALWLFSFQFLPNR